MLNSELTTQCYQTASNNYYFSVPYCLDSLWFGSIMLVCMCLFGFCVGCFVLKFALQRGGGRGGEKGKCKFLNKFHRSILDSRNTLGRNWFVVWRRIRTCINHDLSTMAGRAINIADGQSSLESSSEVSQDNLFTLPWYLLYCFSFTTEYNISLYQE